MVEEDLKIARRHALLKEHGSICRCRSRTERAPLDSPTEEYTMA
jgi:hypothetical protein